MKFAASNIALPEYDHLDTFSALAEMGLSGLEVSPSRAWRDWGPSLSPAEVTRYRRRVEEAGLRVTGLHTLFWQRPDLGLFRDREARGRTLDFLLHLSSLCADLGGKVLVFGSGGARRRGVLPHADAVRETVDFFADLAPRIAGHGTCVVFEPLGTRDTDFINSVAEALEVVERADLPVLRTHLDAKALVQAGEMNEATFRRARPTLAHFHANEPDFGVLGTSGEVDHRAMGRLLRRIGYDGYVSIEQRMLSAQTPLQDLKRSVAVLKACYGADEPPGRDGP